MNYIKLSSDTIGKTIRLLLIANSMSQSDLARALNISRSAVTRKINNQTAFTTAEINIIADLFQISTDSLLGRSRDVKNA
ncbi:MAG: helix-turn-helix domain-containing protein [Parascardovia denticolens]|uniref:helix-turn-helix domain-containing protein n=1 Tax=Parascardovia denticolens TaxID=78258 RepID=UPI0009D655EB|nr:helix-turn-helix transcriptional regulator [Parascardovia denticolens]